MEKNVSEAKEKMAYKKAKAIATWYLTQCKNENAPKERLEISPENAWVKKLEEDKSKTVLRLFRAHLAHSVDGFHGLQTVVFT